MAEKIIERAARLGIPVEDVVIDPLVLTVGSDSKAAMVTLQTIELLRKEFGVNINLGASNVSFGLPDRPTVNAAFLTLAIQMGATCSITDPAKLGLTVRAADMLLGRDENIHALLEILPCRREVARGRGRKSRLEVFHKTRELLRLPPKYFRPVRGVVCSRLRR